MKKPAADALDRLIKLAARWAIFAIYAVLAYACTTGPASGTTAADIVSLLPTSVGDKALATKALSPREMATELDGTTLGAALSATFGTLPQIGARASGRALSILVMRAPGAQGRLFESALQERMSGTARPSGLHIEFEHVIVDSAIALLWTTTDMGSGTRGVAATITFGDVLYVIGGSSRDEVVNTLRLVEELISP